MEPSQAGQSKEGLSSSAAMLLQLRMSEGGKCRPCLCTLQVVACCSSRALQSDVRRVRSRSAVRLHAEPGTKEASTENAVPAEDQGDDMDLVSRGLSLVTHIR